MSCGATRCFSASGLSPLRVVCPAHSSSPSLPSPAHGTIQGPPGEKGERGYPGPKGKPCRPFPRNPCSAGSSTASTECRHGAAPGHSLPTVEVAPSESQPKHCPSLVFLAGLSLFVGQSDSRTNLVFSFLQVTPDRWAHQDATGRGDQKERKERKV